MSIDGEVATSSLTRTAVEFGLHQLLCPNWVILLSYHSIGQQSGEALGITYSREIRRPDDDSTKAIPLPPRITALYHRAWPALLIWSVLHLLLLEVSTTSSLRSRHLLPTSVPSLFRGELQSYTVLPLHHPTVSHHISLKTGSLHIYASFLSSNGHLAVEAGKVAGII